ncbi:hypothetical protein [Parvularcula oceani]|uniref:hypothetical protein n=1 Tax=Parvularcula oceani TaxID=1247963 RepID=UPI0004E12734|nr:hypothetical protein [Parvularcula oceani]
MLIPTHTTFNATPADRRDAEAPLRDAAKDLHRQFLVQMLKDAKLTEALGAKGGEAAALSGFAADALAGRMAEAQPELAERIYQALQRPEGA